ncbi:MAG: NAD(P)/FAD-dependent oxidoreductase [Candidatus Aenigmarchaeota archaeon]|nr:NAD(P)/FAD-dependent oxidoreductase [Candidatus Aenigmarchaeota archaeon]
MAQNTEMHDVIVIGGGIAGCYLANKLKGLDVLVMEKSTATKKDSGIVSTRYDALMGNKAVSEEIYRMEFVSPSNNILTMSSEKPIAYRLNRSKFEETLRKKLGKHVRYERADSIRFSNDGVFVGTDACDYECRLLVGADGALSLARDACGFRRPNIFYGLISEQKKPALNEMFRVYLNKYYSPDFFVWELQNEYGIITAKRPMEYFNFFRIRAELEKNRIYGSPIAIGLTKSFRDNCILLGESCGQTKPLTGGGLIFSMLSAKHAADVISRAFNEDYFRADLLGLYERRWRAELGWEIRKQMFFRSIYRRLTNAAIDRLFLDFGKYLENIHAFDYDHLSKLAYKMPKWKLLKAFLNIAAGM